MTTRDAASGSVTRARFDERWSPYLYAAPVVIYLLAFQGYPLLQQAFLSFTQTSLLTPRLSVPVGFDNYTRLFATPGFRHVLAITAIYTAGCVVGAVALGLAAALLLSAPMRGRGPVRAVMMIPWAAPPIAVALVFSWILNPQYGIAGTLLGKLGVPMPSEGLLNDPSTALVTILVITIWQIFPFAAMVTLTALQGVSDDVREAALMDGASRLSIFSSVVWPAIRPTVTLLTMFTTIWSLRRFELIWVMTQGGPVDATNTLVIDLYRNAFVFRELGQAAAIGMVGLAVSGTITLAYYLATLRAERRESRA